MIRSTIKTGKDKSIDYNYLPLYAIMAAYNESDIIGATIKHLYKQGITKVFVVDNGSTDRTAEEAIKYGAELFFQFPVNTYEEFIRLRECNRCIEEKLSITGTSWWILQDTDEFITGPNDLTIADYLCSLPAHYTTVGSKYLEHWPSPGTKAYDSFSGDNPINYQLLATERKMLLDSATGYHNWVCEQKHWKHNITKQYGKQDLVYHLGQHMLWSKSQQLVIEPEEALVLHHYPYREKAFTIDRFNNLTKVKRKDIIFESGIMNRLKDLENVYSGNYNVVRLPHDDRTVGINPINWKLI